MKRNNHFSSTCIWKITIPRSAYRASEMLIIFNECARYRSIRRMKNIAKNSSSQRILLPAIPLLRRSSPLQFNENFFSAHDFFYWTTSRYCPYTCWKYIKYILPLESVEIFYVDFLVKLLHTYSRSRNADVSHLKNFFLSSFYFILQVYILTFSIRMKEHFN